MLIVGTLLLPFCYARPGKCMGKDIIYIVDVLHFLSQQQVPMLFIRNPKLWCVLIRVVENSWESIWQSWNCLKHWASKTTERSPAKLVCMYNFSQAEENIMRRNGDNDEANWCRLIRQFYRAVDESGVSLTQRVEWLMDMGQFLLSILDCGLYPPPCNDVKNLPIVQYEGILTNIDRRLMLLAESALTQRAASSLDSETFFSCLQDNDPSGSRVMHTDDVKVCLGATCCVLSMKMNNERPFSLNTNK